MEQYRHRAINTKRPHTKSRQGCDQCRKRRVKCDERKPICTTCSKRGDECIFPEPRSRTSTRTSQSKSPSHASWTSSETCSSTRDHDILPDYFSLSVTPYTSASPPFVPSQTALMHHWCTRTCASFTRAGSEVFRDHVGGMALSCDYLLHAIFAVTLLHQASTLEDTAQASFLVDKAIQYQTSAVSRLHEDLNDLSQSNCEAAFICSVLVMVSAIISPLIPRFSSMTSSLASDTIPLLNSLMTGVASVLDVARPWIEQGPIHSFFGIVEPEPRYDGIWEPAKRLRRCINDELGLRGSSKSACLEHAVAGLEAVVNRNMCAVSWLISHGIGLTADLQAGQPCAVLIFVHWAVLLYTTDDMWWKRYAGSRLVDELSSDLLGYSEIRDDTLYWCRAEVNLAE